MFSFGQTGSGKTYTCTAIERKAAVQLFEVRQFCHAGKPQAPTPFVWEPGLR